MVPRTPFSLPPRTIVSFPFRSLLKSRTVMILGRHFSSWEGRELDYAVGLFRETKKKAFSCFFFSAWIESAPSIVGKGQI